MFISAVAAMFVQLITPASAMLLCFALTLFGEMLHTIDGTFRHSNLRRRPCGGAGWRNAGRDKAE
jgi:hypothetical protein